MSTIAENAKAIFLEAIEKNADEWPAVLDRACGDDVELRQRVEGLLQAHQEKDNLFDRPDATVEFKPHESVGQAIGPYKLREKLGEGAFGVVWAAERKEPVYLRVAIKIVKRNEPDIAARFEAERNALSLMDHPNIAKVLDAGTMQNGQPYFVMELVHRGVPITEYCDAHRLQVRERLELFIQVCRAIQHAHQKGIIHRDIKPSNVLVMSNDGVPALKVIDFGVAKAIGQKLTDKSIYTMADQIVGTLPYMSPEQAGLSGIDADTRADVYGLGVLLYELLTGTTPFEAKQLGQVAILEACRIIQYEEPPRPSTKLSNTETIATLAASRGIEPKKLTTMVRGDLDWVVMKSLEKERVRRYETANGLAADVQRVLRQQPVEARPPSALYRLRKFARRHSHAVVAGAVLLVGLSAGMIGIVVGWRRSILANRGLAVAESQSFRSRYVSDMNVAAQAMQSNDLRKAEELLATYLPTEDSPRDIRGLEWYFLSTQLQKSKSKQTPLTLPYPPRKVRFPKDGSRMVVSQVDNTVSVFDVDETGRAIPESRIQLGNPGLNFWFPTQVAVRPDGTKLYRPSDSKRDVSVYDFADGVERALNKAPFQGFVYGLDISSDGRRLGAATNRGEVGVWDTATKQRIVTHEGPIDDLNAVAFSRDGDWFAAGGDDSILRIWDLRDPRSKPRELDSRNKGIFTLHFSPDGRELLVGHGNGNVSVVTKDSMQQGREIRAHRDLVWEIRFAPDQESFATASRDNSIRVWSWPKRELISTLRGHSSAASAAEFVPNRNTLVTASMDGTVQYWRLPLTKAYAEVQLGAKLTCLSQRSEQDGFVVATEQGVYDYDSQRGLTTRFQFGSSVNAVRIARQTIVVRDDQSERFQKLDASNGSLETHCDAAPKQVPLALSEAGGLALIGAKGGAAAIWNLRTGEKSEIGNVTLVNMHRASPPACFAPHQPLVAIADASNDIKLFNTESQRISTLTGHRHVAAIQFSPIEKDVLATASWDGTARIWSIASKEPVVLHSLRHPHAVKALTFDPSGTVLATKSKSLVRFWDVQTGDELISFDVGIDYASTMLFSSKGSELAIASIGGRRLRVFQTGWESSHSRFDLSLGR